MRLVQGNPDDLLTPSEVARFFRVDPKTITRWAQQGRLPSTRTLGGHRRFQVRDLNKAIRAANSGKP